MLNFELLRLANNNVLTTQGQNMGHYIHPPFKKLRPEVMFKMQHIHNAWSFHLPWFNSLNNHYLVTTLIVLS